MVHEVIAEGIRAILNVERLLVCVGFNAGVPGLLTQALESNKTEA
jgi:hypothetical protein